MTLKEKLDYIWNSPNRGQNANHLTGWLDFNGSLRPVKGRQVKEPTDKAAAKRLKKARRAFSKYKGEIK